MTWDASGQYFHFTYRRKQKIVEISALKAAAVNSNNKLPELLQELLPTEVEFSKFSLNDIKGYSTSTGSLRSILDDPVNSSVFESFVDETWKAISAPHAIEEDIWAKTKGDHWCVKKINNYLEKAQKLQDVMLVALHSSMGIPPRTWQVTSLAYRPHQQPNANVNILRGQVVIQNPLAKQRGKKDYDALWGLPPVLGRALIFYLGVIRVIEMKLLEILQTPTDHHQRFVFARHYHTKQKILDFRYSAQQLNTVLRQSELGLDSFEMRHVTVAVLRQHRPELFRSDAGGTSRADRQAQHEDLTGNLNYSPDDVFRSTGFSITQCEEQLCVSHALQELCGLIPTSNDGTSEDQRLHALHVARHQILRDACGYDLVSKDSAEGWVTRSQKAKALLADMPFLYGLGVRFMKQTIC